MAAHIVRYAEFDLARLPLSVPAERAWYHVLERCQSQEHQFTCPELGCNRRWMASGSSMSTLDDVYCKFGEVSEAAQLLETELGNILLMVGAIDADLLENKDPQKVEALFKSINRDTLGQLLKRLHKSVDSAANLESILATALSERNRLAHSFYRQHNFRRNSDVGCGIMLNDLNAMHEVIISALKAVHMLSGLDLDGPLPDQVFPTAHVEI